MSDNALKLLEDDWKYLLGEDNFLDLGKCLRAIIKVHKSSGQLSHKAYEITSKIKVLEDNLNNVEPKARFALVGDIIYSRRAIDSSSTEEFGGAFRKRK